MLAEDRPHPSHPHKIQELESVVVRFAGDSGDGIQVTGAQFTNESAIAGNDLATLPNFPAEIRAPAGTLPGVSSFQINFGSLEINTPGDTPEALVCMNPAALKANLKDLKKGGILILNEDAFTEKNLSRVGYTTNPIEDQSLKDAYRVYVCPMSRLTKDALDGSGLSTREVERSKNFFALGIVLWMFSRPYEHTTQWIKTKFSKTPEIMEANLKSFEAGITYAEATEIFDVAYTIKPAKLAPGHYKNINGTTALAYGLVAAAQKSRLPLFFGAYPITPASDLLHELARHKSLGVTTFQAEDEIAAICSAVGAAFGGSLGVTSSSGPGISLKTEAMALAVMTELPLVIINVQRAGPSTGMPTKTEQADLLQAIYGRAGEAPVCVLAASSPDNAFYLIYEACRIATTFMTPVIFLSDGFIATTAEPWKIPDPQALADFKVNFTTAHNNPRGDFLPYLRDEKTLARPWVKPGTPGLTHRIGGLEKQDKTGNVSYDPDNHHLMCELRREKIERIQSFIPETQIEGENSGELLVVGWGGTEGTLREACRLARQEGHKVSRIHLHYMNPLPPDLGTILPRFSKILVPEINFGQLRSVLRDKYLINALGFNRVAGQPLKVGEVLAEIKKFLTAQ
ncbi:2-oxoacid:acceptor oxidoreductase subunit alpha [bacterium]|nr:2-oxoacid:acceptor oxidoreductase subunit alpha [bacterium]